MWRAPGRSWRRLVVLEHEQHRSTLGGDAIVGDHQRGGQHVAVVSAEAELAVVLVAENAGELQGPVHGRRRALARTNSAARATASAAIPHQSEDHRMWE